MNKPIQSKRKGSALALVMIVLIVMLAMGVGLLSLGQSSRIRAARTGSDIVARCAADAGLTKCIFEMNNKLKDGNEPWTDSNLPHAINETLANCDATFTYSVITDDDNVYNIESIGSSGMAKRKVNCSLKLEGLFEYAIFVQDNLTLQNGTTVDMRNADPEDPVLKIGTNSIEEAVIFAKDGVTIDGDVVVGYGGDPEVVIDSVKEVTITGDAYAAPVEEVLPSVKVPAWLGALPSQGTLSGDTTITTSAKYDSINLNNGEILTINGAVSIYVTGNVTIDNSAQILIADANTNPDASLTMFLKGNLASQNKGVINNSSLDPRKLKVYGLDTCQDIAFKTQSVFYGEIYAPYADVRVYNYVEFYGSVIAGSFLQDVYANFHYDALLRQARINDIGAHFVIKQWSED
ncbi:MAG: hypothetical protein JSV82_06940 [Planctomycetota bacterium]|nr:MAG: hypothetical protein JSV82_06940 [Planctomycetota bacterium]